MHPTHLLWQAAGEPACPQELPGTCRICGESGAGLPFDIWVRDTFTNHDALRPGDIICHICQFSFAQDGVLLQQRTGKGKPQKMQNYSHVVANGEWHPLHKGQKAQMLTLLRESPELAAIAVSGQKHIVFRARPGWWQVEEQTVRPNLAALDSCLSLISPLYTVFSKAEIETGNYAPHRTMQYAQAHGLESFLSAETALAAWRGTPYFDLALYLAQKEAQEDADTTAGLERVPGAVSSGADAAFTPLARPERGAQTEIRPQHLGAVRGQHPGGGVHVEPEQVLQLDLFQTGDHADG